MSDWAVETVDLEEQARQEIETARVAGVDPLNLADTHVRLAAWIKHLLAKELADV